MSTAQLPGHLFLASLGKKMLRPGGIRATTQIIDFLELNENSKLLEVAPNMGTTAIMLAKTYGCSIVAVDMHAPSLEKARENIAREGLEDKITLIMGDARKLPFEDNQFDAVINEAMLTMLPNKEKLKALAEYRRVLKPGGKLGTHDITLTTQPSRETMEQFWKMMKMAAMPLEEAEWKGLFEETGFARFDMTSGPMSLVTLNGLITDEGWEGTLEILRKAKENKETEERFLAMSEFFEQQSQVFRTCVFLAQK
jgi:SAM-dependent methyltransferase